MRAAAVQLLISMCSFSIECPSLCPLSSAAWQGEKIKLTGRILAAADFNELLDIGDFGRHGCGGREVCDCDDECSWNFVDFGEAEFVWVDSSGLACGLSSWLKSVARIRRQWKVQGNSSQLATALLQRNIFRLSLVKHRSFLTSPTFANIEDLERR
jgi:hypothetical protein